MLAAISFSPLLVLSVAILAGIGSDLAQAQRDMVQIALHMKRWVRGKGDRELLILLEVLCDLANQSVNAYHILRHTSSA
eukprot:4468230-Amphidinium_carterae.1